jgi:hypothetical protein
MKHDGSVAPAADPNVSLNIVWPDRLIADEARPP